MSLISANKISVFRDGRRVLDSVDLSIDRGEIVTIVGPNGSGKSTLVESLVGSLQPDSGVVTRSKGLRIGYVPQKLQIDASMPMPVRRFLSLPNRHGRSARAHALAQVGLSEAIENQPLTGLSGGQFQRVLLARAILMKPDLLVLDEATRGLDQPGTASFYELVEDLRRVLDCGILMVSHDLHVVMSASDRVICLNGHICCHGTPEIVASAPEYRALFGMGTRGTLALYRHTHDHGHDDAAEHGCEHDHAHDHSYSHGTEAR